MIYHICHVESIDLSFVDTLFYCFGARTRTRIRARTWTIMCSHTYRWVKILRLSAFYCLSDKKDSNLFILMYMRMACFFLLFSAWTYRFKTYLLWCFSWLYYVALLGTEQMLLLDLFYCWLTPSLSNILLQVTCFNLGSLGSEGPHFGMFVHFILAGSCLVLMSLDILILWS